MDKIYIYIYIYKEVTVLGYDAVFFRKFRKIWLLSHSGLWRRNILLGECFRQK